MSARTMTGARQGSGKLPRFGLALIGVLLIAVNLRASFTAVGPVLDEMRQDLSLSATAAGLLSSLPLLAFAAFSPLAPAVSRRLGLDRSLWAALALLTIGILARSAPFVPGVWIGTGLLGIGIAFINVLLPSLVKRDFPHRVAQVTGIYSAVQSTAAALATGVVVPIANATPLGWRLALGVWAGLGLLAMAALLPRLLRGGRRSAAPMTEAAAFRSPWKAGLAWQVTLFMGLQSVPFFVFVAWLPSMLHDRGVSAEAAGWYLFIFQVAAVLGNLATATLAHRARDQRLIAFCGGTLAFAAFTGLLLAPQLALLWTLSCGLACGSMIVLALSLFSLRTRNPAQAAALSGMAQSVGYLLAACGPIVFGALHDLSGGWTLSLGLIALVMIAMCTFGVLAGRDRVLR